MPVEVLPPILPAKHNTTSPSYHIRKRFIQQQKNCYDQEQLRLSYSIVSRSVPRMHRHAHCFVFLVLRNTQERCDVCRYCICGLQPLFVQNFGFYIILWYSMSIVHYLSFQSLPQTSCAVLLRMSAMCSNGHFHTQHVMKGNSLPIPILLPATLI